MSSPNVGSSKNKIFGLCIKAANNYAFILCPKDNFRTGI